MPKNCTRLCSYCGGAVDSIILVLLSCIGQASTLSLRPCLSQSDTWLLIYGREMAIFVVASKTATSIKISFQTEASGIVLKLSQRFFKKR